MLAEPLPKDPNGVIKVNIPPMEALAQYGLTLQWSSVNASCSSSFAGYHVYRSRRQRGAPLGTDDSAPPIRLTRDPVSLPQLRVQYLSSINQTALPTPLFPGLPGYLHDPGSAPDGVTYAVTSVDTLGKESFSSSGVSAHSDSQDRTRFSAQPNGPKNYEKRSGLALLPLISGAVESPGPVDASRVSWQWHYGHRGLFQAGPAAGNWVLMKWGDLTHEIPGHPNEIRIWRQAGPDPNYRALEVGFIPGDDLGLRQFVWQMPLELACADANYRVQGVDLFGGAGPWSDPPTFVPKYRLIPENPRATLNGTSVTIGWDALQGCGEDPSHGLQGYKVLRSSNPVSSCLSGGSSTMPPNESDYIVVSNPGVLPPGQTTSQHTPLPASDKYWYRVKAYWGANGTNPSDLSAGICTSASQGPAPANVFALYYGHPAITDWSYSPACLSGSFGDCPIGVVWDPVPATVGPVQHYNVYRSDNPVGTCQPASMPLSPVDYTFVGSTTDGTKTSFQHSPQSIARFWFRVTAVYPGGESPMSPGGGCSAVGGGGSSENMLPDDPGPEGRWRLASSAGDATIPVVVEADGMCLLSEAGRVTTSAAATVENWLADGEASVDTTAASLSPGEDVGYSYSSMEGMAQRGAVESAMCDPLELIDPETAPSMRIAVASADRSGSEAQRWPQGADLSPYRVVGQSSSNPPIRMSFYHLDHLGTPRVITDALGQPISYHKYLPFGEELNPPPSTNTHKFTGHERDRETGMDYMFARYYGSNLGRLMSVDPVGGQLGSPQAWNLYAYVGNNPIAVTDPLGLYKVTGEGADQL
ncbi:MAG: RHS repeat-associated core domain-containing protein, partial [Gemmatimonadales bacterium]